LGLTTRADIAGTYADAESAVPLVAIIEAAARVADANEKYLAAGKGTPVSAVLTANSFGIIDPNNA
jgi:hypothetical protein